MNAFINVINMIKIKDISTQDSELNFKIKALIVDEKVFETISYMNTRPENSRKAIAYLLNKYYASIESPKYIDYHKKVIIRRDYDNMMCNFIRNGINKRLKNEIKILTLADVYDNPEYYQEYKGINVRYYPYCNKCGFIKLSERNNHYDPDNNHEFEYQEYTFEELMKEVEQIKRNEEYKEVTKW